MRDLLEQAQHALVARVIGVRPEVVAGATRIPQRRREAADEVLRLDPLALSLPPLAHRHRLLEPLATHPLAPRLARRDVRRAVLVQRDAVNGIREARQEVPVADIGRHRLRRPQQRIPQARRPLHHR